MFSFTTIAIVAGFLASSALAQGSSAVTLFQNNGSAGWQQLGTVSSNEGGCTSLDGVLQNQDGTPVQNWQKTGIQVDVLQLGVCSSFSPSVVLSRRHHE